MYMCDSPRFHTPMAEQAPIPQPEERFTDPYHSRFYQFGQELQMPGDPTTPDDFMRAQDYLETITARSLQRGSLWNMKPADIVADLDYHNAWHQYEVEQERRGGDRTAEYREINLKQLQALSRRRVLAFEDTGWEVTQAYRAVRYFDQILSTAVFEQEQFEQLMATSTQ